VLELVYHIEIHLFTIIVINTSEVLELLLLEYEYTLLLCKLVRYLLHYTIGMCE